MATLSLPVEQRQFLLLVLPPSLVPHKHPREPLDAPQRTMPPVPPWARSCPVQTCQWVLGYLAGHITDAAHAPDAGWCLRPGGEALPFDEQHPPLFELMASLRGCRLLHQLRHRFAEAVVDHAPATAYFRTYWAFASDVESGVPPGIFFRPDADPIDVSAVLAEPSSVLPQWEPIVAGLHGHEHEQSAMHTSHGGPNGSPPPHLPALNNQQQQQHAEHHGVHEPAGGEAQSGARAHAGAHPSGLPLGTGPDCLCTLHPNGTGKLKKFHTNAACNDKQGGKLGLKKPMQKRTPPPPALRTHMQRAQMGATDLKSLNGTMKMVAKMNRQSAQAAQQQYIAQHQPSPSEERGAQR